MILLHTTTADVLVDEDYRCVGVHIDGRWLSSHALLGCRWLGSARLDQGRPVITLAPMLEAFALFEGFGLLGEIQSYATFATSYRRETRRDIS